MGAVKIGSYNIQRGIGLDLRRDIGRTADVLAELDCDVVGLQEVVVRDGEARDDQARYLADRLGMDVVIGATRPHNGGLYGNAVLTRLPILRVERFDLTIGSREPRG